MPAVTRELSIVYGSITLGGSTDRLIDGWHFVRKSFETAELEVEFWVQKDTVANFQTEVAAIEAEFRKPFQNVTVTLDGQTLVSASQSGNTGMDAQPEIVKRGQIGDTGRSRKYTVRITWDLPANTGAEPTTGLRESAVDVSYSQSRRRTVRISGIFTAVPSSTARAQYDAQISAYESSVLSAIGGTYELVGEPVSEHSTNNKTLRFERTHREVIFSQAGASTDDADIVDQQLSITRRHSGEGVTPEATRLVTLDVSYDAWIDKDQTTDLKGKWEDAIRGWIITQAETVLGGGAVAMMEEAPEFMYDDNRIRASMTLFGIDAEAGKILENRITVSDDDNIGKELVPAWTGNPFSKYQYQGPRQLLRTIAQTLRVQGHETLASAAATGSEAEKAFRDTPFFEPPAEGGGWVLMQRQPSATQLTLGRAGKEQIDVTDITVTTTLEWVVPVSAGATSGGGGAVTTQPTVQQNDVGPTTPRVNPA